MISHDFTYARPEAKEEAIALFKDFLSQGLEPLYYGGGSEIITMSRSGSIKPGAVIDIKGIPEANVLELSGEHLIMGGCVTLRAITDAKLFPLLGTVAGRIADHTNQCRITLGGNLCSTILYRETVQPLLLCNAQVVLFGPQGQRSVGIQDVFYERMVLGKGELVLQVRIPRRYLTLKYGHVKKTANERIDYPLISLSAIQTDRGPRFAFSGVLPYPFRSKEMEKALGQKGTPVPKRVIKALACLPQPPMTDYQGSGDYRLFVLGHTLTEMLGVLET